MEKKKFRLGLAISITFHLIVNYPKFILLPILVRLIINIVDVYLRYQVPFFSFVSQADRALNPGRGTLLASSLRSLYSVLFFLLLLLITFISLNGYIHIFRKWLDQKEKPEWRDFFTWNFSLFGRYIVLSLLIERYSPSHPFGSIDAPGVDCVMSWGRGS